MTDLYISTLELLHDPHYGLNNWQYLKQNFFHNIIEKYEWFYRFDYKSLIVKNEHERNKL